MTCFAIARYYILYAVDIYLYMSVVLHTINIFCVCIHLYLVGFCVENDDDIAVLLF